MPEARYRLRRPVLFWAFIGPLAAGVVMIFIVSLLTVAGPFLWQGVTTGSFASPRLALWPALLWNGLAYNFLPLVLTGLIAALVLGFVRPPPAGTRGGSLMNTDLAAWLCLILIAGFFRPGLWALMMKGEGGPLFSVMPNVPAMLWGLLAVALLVRPVFLRIVTEKVSAGSHFK
jgi:hypothetical protein